MLRTSRLSASSMFLAATLFVAVGCTEQNETLSRESTSPAVSQTENTETTGAESGEEFIAVVFTKPTTIEFSVPDMMCPHGCYPGIKEALSEQPNVVSIELGTPAEEKADSINDRRVIITTEGEFDATAAVAAFPAHLQEGVEVQEVATASPESEPTEG